MASAADGGINQMAGGDEPNVAASLREHLATIERLMREDIAEIQEAADLMIRAFSNGRKLLICGNGGSAAQSQHIAAEFVGRFERQRRAYPAIALTTDASVLTAVANDDGFDRVFARQVVALGEPGDVLIAISTSGKSLNVLEAARTARQRGCKVIGLTGADGGELVLLSDVAITVPSSRTSRIQEAHMTIVHAWCELVDFALRA